MRGLHALLPTLSSDFSGACSALYELGGLVVVHGPHGCYDNVIVRDEARAARTPSRVFGSALSDMDATFGDDEKLIARTCETFAEVGGRFIALLGTPSTMVIGTDYDAVAAEMGRRCGVPAFAVATSGEHSYAWGAGQALLEVAQAAVAPMRRQDGTTRTANLPRTANLLGATPLDLTGQAVVNAARSVLDTGGWHVASCWAMDSSLEELAAGLDAQVNVVLTRSGLPLARWMRDELGIPYVWGLLSGEHAAAETLERMERAASGASGEPVAPLPGETGEGRGQGGQSGQGGDVPDDAHAQGGTPLPRRALVVGDRVLAESMRRTLELDAGFGQVDVATLASDDDPASGPGDTSAPRGDDIPPARPGDVLAADEGQLVHLVRDGGYDLVVGDPLLASLVNAGTTRPAFIPVPWVALAGRLVWPGSVCPYGPRFLDAVRRPRLAAEMQAVSGLPHAEIAPNVDVALAQW